MEKLEPIEMIAVDGIHFRLGLTGRGVTLLAHRWSDPISRAMIAQAMRMAADRIEQIDRQG